MGGRRDAMRARIRWTWDLVMTLWWAKEVAREEEDFCHFVMGTGPWEEAWRM